MSRWRSGRGASLIERIARGDTYVLLFVLLLVYYFTLSLIPLNRSTRLLLVSISVITLLLALHASHVHPRLMRIAFVASGLAVTLAVIEFSTGDHLVSGSTSITIGLLLLITPAVILRRIFEHPRVDIETIAGAIDVYFLLGIIFGFLYLGIQDIDSTPFFEQINHADAGEFMYFSFITLTTVGFGDLTPADDLGRALAGLEAVSGAVFLVTLVARLVALYGTERPPGVSSTSTRSATAGKRADAEHDPRR